MVIMREWFAEVAPLFQHGTVPFPDDYTVFDVETSGISRKDDYILQLGYAFVRNRQLREHGTVLLDWTRCDQIDQVDLRRRIESTAKHMTKKGKPYRFTYAGLREGEDPIASLDQYFRMLRDHVENRILLVGHNAWDFDARMCNGNFDRFLDGRCVSWFVDSIFDTGLAEKASRMPATPFQGENLCDFYKRVSDRPMKGLFWSLADFCAPKYGLAEKYGLDMANAHDAGFDCLLNHYLFEHFRDIKDGLPGTELEIPF